MKRVLMLLVALLFAPLCALETAEPIQPAPGAPRPQIEIPRFQPDQPVSRALRPASVSAEVINLGDADNDVTVTLVLPQGVRLLRASAERRIHLASSDGEERLTWELEPGAATSVELKLELAVDGKIVA
jgi:hypothetical protein